MSSNVSPITKPTARLIRWPEVQPIVGICRSHAHKLVTKGLFPQPVKLGERASAWVESEIFEWVEQRIQESRNDSNMEEKA